MTIETEEKLRQAIDSGEVVKIEYSGGSQPGALRDIAPISVSDGKVRARCFTSKAVKLFVIAKIRVIDGQEEPTGSEWTPEARSEPLYGSLSELLDKEQSFLSRLGWHMETGENTVSLHRRFKSGKPMKGSDVSLDYEEFTFELVLGEDGEFHQEDKRKRKRPWIVRAKNQDTRTFAAFERAAIAFMECAEGLAPIGTH